MFSSPLFFHETLDSFQSARGLAPSSLYNFSLSKKPQASESLHPFLFFFIRQVCLSHSFSSFGTESEDGEEAKKRMQRRGGREEDATVMLPLSSLISTMQEGNGNLQRNTKDQNDFRSITGGSGSRLIWFLANRF